MTFGTDAPHRLRWSLVACRFPDSRRKVKNALCYSVFKERRRQKRKPPHFPCRKVKGATTKNFSYLKVFSAWLEFYWAACWLPVGICHTREQALFRKCLCNNADRAKVVLLPSKWGSLASAYPPWFCFQPVGNIFAAVNQNIFAIESVRCKHIVGNISIFPCPLIQILSIFAHFHEHPVQENKTSILFSILTC